MEAKKQYKNAVLVTLADENYVDQAKQLFSSAYWNAGWQGDYLLLSHKIPKTKLECFKKKGILINQCKPLDEKANQETTVLSKSYLLKDYFKKWDKIIYLDSDIIIRAPLEKLTNIKSFGAIKDTKSLKDNFLKKDLKKRLKEYNIYSESFNSGVMAINTKVIKPDSFAKIIQLLKKNKDILYWGDQPIFNLFFYKRWEKIPKVYNVLLSGKTIRRFFSPKKVKGIVLHFVTPDKPWIKDNHFYNEWKTNLDKFELIDLNKIPKKKPWNKKKVIKYSKYLKIREYFLEIYFKIDSNIGAVGIFLRKKFPHISLIFKSG
jgi:lipopolysaccharide biosynthesis glycosyltransferase